MKRIQTAIAMNIFIAMLVAFAVWAMISGFHFMSGASTLSAVGWIAFRYFTVDSNILMGLAAAIMAGVQIHSAKSKTEVPVWATKLKLAATTATTLTMLITCLYLAPTSSMGYFSLFVDANLFLHFVIPVLAILVFIFQEGDSRLSLRHTLYGIAPMALYAGYYFVNVVTHIQNGTVSRKYDWYHFLMFGVKSIPLVLAVIFSLTWLISFLLWRLNKTKKEKSPC